MAHLQLLPNELLFFIILHLSVGDISHLCQTCKDFHYALTDELYREAAFQDEHTHGWPSFLMRAAYLGRNTSFEAMLGFVKEEIFSSVNTAYHTETGTGTIWKKTPHFFRLFVL